MFVACGIWCLADVSSVITLGAGLVHLVGSSHPRFLLFT